MSQPGYAGNSYMPKTGSLTTFVRLSVIGESADKPYITRN